MPDAQALACEQNLFAQEYEAFYLAGETKPREIGAPFLLHHPAYRRGVLLIHGLMAAPEEVRELADFLFAQGYNVYAPRMAGHGTSALDLDARTAVEWEASVVRGQAILAQCCEQVVIAGFSTGGAIALHRVIAQPAAFAAVISISAPLKFRKFSAHLAGPITQLNRLLTSVGLSRWRKVFVTNHADNPHINYLRCPISSIAQIQALMRNVRRGLGAVKIPALVIHAGADPKVDVQSSRDIFSLLGSVNKRYREIDFHQHGIIRGEIGKQVFDEVGSFLKSLW